ncbi:MAG: Na(+)/H(+) antiporter subunit D, partial [Desulfobacteraceae bacterium]|nr:Na(+)/H(+) antiporter subunit D [Desulfobacteraceae bacterium]
IAAFLCIGIGVYPQPLYNLLPYAVNYIPYTGAHVVGQLQLLLFGAFAFTLLILSGYYIPEIRSKNLDADWTYRKLGRFAYKIADKGLNYLNKLSEIIIINTVKVIASFLKDTVAKLALFIFVNFWLIMGFSGTRLEIKKSRLYDDIMNGTLPIGLGAAVATFFILLIFLLA